MREKEYQEIFDNLSKLLDLLCRLLLLIVGVVAYYSFFLSN